MKKLFYIILTFLVFANFSIAYAISAPPKTLIIINHYNHPLRVVIDRYPFYLPGWPVEFHLQIGERSRETIIVQGPESDSQAFVRVESEQPGSPYVSTFLGIRPDGIRILRDPSFGFAFSWDDNQNQTLIFCDSLTYSIKKHC